MSDACDPAINPAQRIMRIAVLLTCFNRRDKTLACLRCLAGQDPAGVELDYVIVDDGSRDGTREAVAAEFPQARVLTGDGSLYWCGGMRMAWRAAALAAPDYYLLANDDTLLDRDAIASLLEIVPQPSARIIGVAAIRDPDGGRISYGGIRTHVGYVPPNGTAERCDTFNANAVLVPRAVYEEIGIFHGAYTHGLGDFDYGYEATRRGIQVLQSPRFLGSCDRNALGGTWRDRHLPRGERWRLLQSPKGLPFREWLVFNRRNSGWKWPWYTISPMLRILLGR